MARLLGLIGLAPVAAGCDTTTGALGIAAAAGGGPTDGTGSGTPAQDAWADTGDAATQDLADGPGSDAAGPPDPATCSITQGDAKGPFYLAGSPAQAQLAAPDEPGDALAISGRVFGPDCLTPVAGAAVEVWQADSAGEYHPTKLRASLVAGADGGYAYWTVRPGPYLQAGGYRPAHMHYRVTAPGFAEVITQLYFEGDPYLAPNDSCGGCGSDDAGRIIPLTAEADGVLVGAFDVVLAAATR